MRSRSLLVALLILFAFNGFGQWKWVYPQPCGNPVISIAATDPNHAWMVGAGGTILSTRNGGRTWQTFQTDTNEMMWSVCFTDSLHGWASSYEGYVHRTIDGGKHWIRSPKIGNYLMNLSFTDKNHGFVGGNDYSNNVYRTRDGGKTWDTVHAGDLKGTGYLAFADSLHGWVCGDASEFQHTTDGGITWTGQDTLPKYVRDLHFYDTLTGYAMTFWDNGIHFTQDGGENWDRMSDPPFIARRCVFPDRQHGWAAGFEEAPPPDYVHGKIARTTDGGQSYKDIYTAPGTSYMNSIGASDSLHAWAAGEGGMIFATKNGGVSWERQDNSFGSPVQLNDISILPDRHTAWAVGEPGLILKTTDDGATWEKQSCGTDSALNAVHFVDENYGIAVGNGSIFMTTDGGTNWNPSNNGLSGDFTDLFFQDYDHAWMTAKRALYESTDAGYSWNQVFTINENIDLNTIRFSDPLHGQALAWGDNTSIFYSKLFLTSDGGKTWDSARFDNYRLRSLSFPDSLNGWLCGDLGTIIRTRDGGKTWAYTNGTSATSYYSIAFSDTLRGWAVGEGSTMGIALYTDDGGETWVHQDAGLGVGMRKVNFPDPGYGFVVGENGAILRWGHNPYGIPEPGGSTPSLQAACQPNPFTDRATILFTLPVQAHVTMTLCDILGKPIETLADKEMPAGTHEQMLSGGNISPGVYLCRIRAGGTVQTVKVVKW